MVSVYVNTDAKMDQDMLDALTRFEFHCCMELRTEAEPEEIAAVPGRPLRQRDGCKVQT